MLRESREIRELRINAAMIGLRKILILKERGGLGSQIYSSRHGDKVPPTAGLREKSIRVLHETVLWKHRRVCCQT